MRVLTITAGNGFYDEELTASLARPMPELRELQLVDVAFERVILTEVRARANPNPHPHPHPDPDPNPNPDPALALGEGGGHSFVVLPLRAAQAPYHPITL